MLRHGCDNVLMFLFITFRETPNYFLCDKRVKYFSEFTMELVIEKLSDDVLMEVFALLDGKSLKNAALVCKK